MKETVNETRFRDAFRDAYCKENFSYDGLGLLFEYFTELEESTGEEIELDVIAICCEYSEDSAEDIAANYSLDLSDCREDADSLDDDAVMAKVREYLEENTAIVGEVAGGFVYAQF